ncbi:MULTISPECIES: MBL fold metallo-hydrolase [unclassified Aeromicrobium]|uniref:ComEC/Rec2 family competence protein n=1 Tax=unclassified Aeromicrobium TaxID=2633570 RepID=UPI00288BB95F|nr:MULTISPECIES: MBL fold metallo-hydrolase [unclassified Aeromicrobium]
MHEVDYLWVGEKSNTGDAIAMRFTRPDTGTDAVVVIDGGFKETGDRIADLIEEFYDTTTIDLAICTHPDDDHIMGLFTLLERATVTTLLLHRPRDFGFGPSDNVKSETVEDLIALAERRGTHVEAGQFAGTRLFGGALTIAGPTRDYYAETLAEQRALTGSVLSKIAHTASTTFARVRQLIRDPGETMTGDNGGTTPRNNSSIIVNFLVGDKRALFTGDAGTPALTHAANTLDLLGLSAAPLDLFDIPHHGSRHNLTPELLDRLLGPQTDSTRGFAIASVGKQAHDHPRPEVANAIRRRGYPVVCTRGINLRWSSPDAPSRASYSSPAEPLGWLEETT